MSQTKRPPTPPSVVAVFLLLCAACCSLPVRGRDACGSGCRTVRSDTLYCRPNAELTQVPGDIGSGVIDVDLSSNCIQRIDAQSFAHLSRLEILNLRNNKISVLDRGAFSGLLGVSELDLSENELADVTDGAFQPSSFGRLSLGFNNLTSLRPGMFDGLSMTRNLSLRYNHIHTIAPGTFTSIRGLYSLDLLGNRLTVIQGAMFAGLEDVTLLVLSDNRIQVLENGSFSSVERLEVLDLRFNNISSLNGSLTGLWGLKELYLGGNQIATLEEEDFWGTNDVSLMWGDNPLTCNKSLCW